jgi:hypothetical protein
MSFAAFRTTNRLFLDTYSLNSYSTSFVPQTDQSEETDELSFACYVL